MAADAAAEAYLTEAASWDRDRTLTAQMSARRAWLVAGAGWIVAGMAVAAVWGLTPLKRVVPLIIRVDNSTGVVDVVPALESRASMSETVTRYLLTHYVTVCERFNFSTAESDYAECGAFHSPALNQAWYARWNPGNPDSPLNRYKDGTELHVDVQAVSFLNTAGHPSDLAQVRYAVTHLSGGDTPSQVTHWIATLQYAYVDPSSNPTVRQWNPLGFRIAAFHPEREAVMVAPGTGAAPGGTASGPFKESDGSEAQRLPAPLAEDAAAPARAEVAASRAVATGVGP